MTDFVISLIRTVVPIVVGSLIGLLVAAGISLPESAAESLTAGIIALATAAYYAAARWAETRWPAAGYLLGTRAAPTYSRDVAPLTLTPDETAMIRDLRAIEGRDEDTGQPS